MNRTVRLTLLNFIVIALCLIPYFSWGRGGGGCLIEGTGILTPNGKVAIEGLRRGDLVWSLIDGKLTEATVQALTRVSPGEYLEISTAETKLRVTPEHPIMVARGEYRIAGRIGVGDSVYLIQDGVLKVSRVTSVTRLPSEQSVYNLLVSPGGTYAAEGLVVHNKGCFLPESQVLKSNGTEVPISALKRGDDLMAFTSEGRLVRTEVREILRHEVDQYYVLCTDRTQLRVTAEHPFYVGGGTYKTVEALKEGDTVYAWDGQWWTGQRIVSLTKVQERVRVFNLQTDHPNTFFAGRIAVHNKGGGGGCFPSGTLISTPGGYVAIETLTPGDEILAIDETGRTVRSRVKTIFIDKNTPMEIRTDQGTFSPTEDHPVKLWRGEFLPAGSLKPGDHILKSKDGRLVPCTVHGVQRSYSEKLVFNLQVDFPHTFIVEKILVHNKGGGGSSRSSSSRSSSRSSSSSGGSSDLGGWFVLGIFLFVATLFVFIAILASKGRKKSENLDFVYSRNKIAPKAGKTEKLLLFLSRQDPSVNPAELRKVAETTFRKLQECWQARDYTPMKPLMMMDLFNQHQGQLQGMIRNHEINKIENVKVDRTDIVNIRYTDKPDQREFTALITASARDYYVDDRTGKFLRGDQTSAQFQEFWTFQRTGNGWLLREIEQAGESDVLKDENFVETLTDDTVKGIYRETAVKKGEAGPWLEKEVEAKATRIDRMLNFLVQTDKLWNRNEMLERARQVFLGIYLSKESGDPGKVPVQDLFPAIAEHLRKQIEQWQKEGLKVEYRNLCVRKAELILVRNFADRAKDEFTVRISAHAQRITRKNDRTEYEQEYVTPFEEFWTFGRLDNQWKLKEVLPPGRGKKKMAEENVDEESSPDQLQWYYRQTRAQ